jgi:hypothetical protein
MSKLRTPGLLWWFPHSCDAFVHICDPCLHSYHLLRKHYIQDWPEPYIYTVYGRICLVIFLPKIPYIHTVYVVLATLIVYLLCEAVVHVAIQPCACRPQLLHEKDYAEFSVYSTWARLLHGKDYAEFNVYSTWAWLLHGKDDAEFSVFSVLYSVYIALELNCFTKRMMLNSLYSVYCIQCI